ncbi:MAG: lipid-A-disaccharide synthase [Prochlorothrix sp.]
MPVFSPTDPPTDVLILSNGPGELATWVRPVVRELRRRWGDDRQGLRISLVLSPCNNASGQEVSQAQAYPELDRIQGAEHFFPFLLWGRTAEHWDWRSRGVVVFLGGDQFFPVVIGKRLGYRIVVYGEWRANWPRWVDRFGVMSPQVLEKAPAQYRHKYAVVGDLMIDTESDSPDAIDRSWTPAQVSPEQISAAKASVDPAVARSGPGGGRVPDRPWRIGLLPGSKAVKLGVGVPLLLAVADRLQAILPAVEFWIPIAPTLTVDSLARYAQPVHNPYAARLPGPATTLVHNPPQLPRFCTERGTIVELDPQFPAHDRLRQCDLCLTTVGANTAELGALGIPMIVLVPSNYPEIMKAWDGIPGLIANIPGLGTGFVMLYNRWIVTRLGLMAWPNLWAGEMIVPELVGVLTVEQVTNEVLGFLRDPGRLMAVRDRLRQVRGEAGAAQKLVDLIETVL